MHKYRTNMRRIRIEYHDAQWPSDCHRRQLDDGIACSGVLLPQNGPQLAWFFQGSFWKGSVLQLSLVEPSVRQAISAIGSLHEYKASLLSRRSYATGVAEPDSAVRLYMRAIRAVLNKAAADASAMPIVVVACILFTFFEYLRGNVLVAASHLSSGINFLTAWREKTGTQPQKPWGHGYLSFDSHFMETELAPVISTFNIYTSETNPGTRMKFLLNPVDAGSIILADRFDSVQEAKVAMIDMATATVGVFQLIHEKLEQGQFPTAEEFATIAGLRHTRDHWKANFDDLVRRQESGWNQEQCGAANILRLMWYSTIMGVTTFRMGSESAWDNHRSHFKEIVRLVESLIAGPEHYPDEFSRILNLDYDLLYPLHVVTWKCRWPMLRRKGLDILRRMPAQVWWYNVEHYYIIFSRIMHFEEAHLDYGDDIPDDATLIPKSVRVHDFYTLPYFETG